MKNILRLEELAMFLISIYAFSTLHYSWYWFPVLLLTPDVGMIGYLINSRIGAFTYNLFHTKISAIALFAIGVYMQSEIMYT